MSDSDSDLPDLIDDEGAASAPAAKPAKAPPARQSSAPAATSKGAAVSNDSDSDGPPPLLEDGVDSDEDDNEEDDDYTDISEDYDNDFDIDEDEDEYEDEDEDEYYDSDGSELPDLHEVCLGLLPRREFFIGPALSLYLDSYARRCRTWRTILTMAPTICLAWCRQTMSSSPKRKAAPPLRRPRRLHRHQSSSRR
jgi:hypothetical protein